MVGDLLDRQPAIIHGWTAIKRSKHHHVEHHRMKRLDALMLFRSEKLRPEDFTHSDSIPAACSARLAGHASTANGNPWQRACANSWRRA